MRGLAALAADRVRLALRGPSAASGALAAAIATLLALALPGLDPSERARSAIAALSGLATVLGGLVVAAAGAARVAHERATRRLAVERAAPLARTALVLAEMAHVGAIAVAVAIVAGLGAAVAGGRDGSAAPRPAVAARSIEEALGAATTIRFLSPFPTDRPDSGVRLALVPVVRKVPPDIPPRIANVTLRFAASGRVVSLAAPNESLASVPLEPGDVGPSGEVRVEVSPAAATGFFRARVAAAKLEGPPGSVAWNALAFAIGLAARLAVLGALAVLVGSLARPALAAAFGATVLAYGLFGGAAAGYAAELAARPHSPGGLPWGGIAALASVFDAIVPDLSRLSLAPEWVSGQVVPAAAVARVVFHAALLCGGLCAICIALFRRQEVLSSA